MQIELDNDRKQKYQSVTASTEGEIFEAMYNYTMDFEAFGSDDVEALRNLLVSAGAARTAIEKLIVDCTNNIIDVLEKQTEKL